MRVSVLLWLLTIVSGCLAQDLLLFWQLYSVVVRGGSILHDISRGVGAVSRAMEAIDSFMISHDEEGGEQKAQAEVFDGPNTSPNTPPVPAPTNQEFTGCGALGFHIKDSTLPVTKLTDCCGGHATCYASSCKVVKRDCDNKLKKCLMAVCNDKSLDKTVSKTCQAAGKLMYSGTMALSFQQYHDAQASINCKKSDSKQKDSKKSKRRGR